MNALGLRGACPGLSAPMQTGDGLLVRLMPAAPVPLDAMAGFCEAARRHGNGTIEVSARGSLQVRGLTPHSAPLFASAVAELGIAAQEGVPVIAGFDVTGADLASPVKDDAVGMGPGDVAADLRRAIANAGLTLPPKVSVVVDGEGGLHLDAVTADVRLRAAQSSRGPQFGMPGFYLGVGGDGASAVWLGTVAAADVAHPVLGLLRMIAARGVRAAEILRTEGVEAFAAVAAALVAPASAPPRRMPAEMIGLHSRPDGTISAGIGLAFGHTHADALAEIVRLAATGGARAVWPLPDRALLLIGASAPDALKITLAAQQLGFVVHADDPRRRIAACPGAPACLSGLIPARAVALALAPLLASIGAGSRGPFAAPSAVVEEGPGGGSAGRSTQVHHGTPRSPQSLGETVAALLRHELAHTAVDQVIGERRDIALHISGCPKGCAHPMPAALTVVGTPRGCGVVHHGCACETPRHYLDPANLSAGIGQPATQTGEAAHG
jgi:precorrin-3B synthase